MVKAYAWAISKRSGNDNRFNPELGPCDHWWYNFMKRHPELTLRKTDSLECDRANEPVVDEYFEMLENALDERID